MQDLEVQDRAIKRALAARTAIQDSSARNEIPWEISTKKQNRVNIMTAEPLEMKKSVSQALELPRGDTLSGGYQEDDLRRIRSHVGGSAKKKKKYTGHEAPQNYKIKVSAPTMDENM